MLRPTVLTSLLAALSLSACGLPQGLPFLDSGGTEPVVIVQTADQVQLIAEAMVAAQARANHSAELVPLALPADDRAEQMDTQFAALDAEQDQMVKENAQLRWALQQAKSSNSSLEAQLAAIGGDAQAIQSELAHKDAALGQLQSQLSSTSGQVRQAEVERERALRSLDRVQRELEGQTAMIYEIEREMNHLQRRAQQGRAAMEQVDELQRRLSHVENRLGALREKSKQVDELKATVSRLRTRLAQAQGSATTRTANTGSGPANGGPGRSAGPSSEGRSPGTSDRPEGGGRSGQVANR